MIKISTKRAKKQENNILDKIGQVCYLNSDDYKRLNLSRLMYMMFPRYEEKV